MGLEVVRAKNEISLPVAGHAQELLFPIATQPQFHHLVNEGCFARYDESPCCHLRFAAMQSPSGGKRNAIPDGGFNSG